MAKETHRVRVWARRDRTRHLEFSEDEPQARDAALAVVERLQGDDSVDAIDLEEDILVREEIDGEDIRARRGTLRWLRSGDNWRQVPV